MTLHEMSAQLKSLAVNGQINGLKSCTRQWIEQYIKTMFRDAPNGKQIFMTILLPDRPQEWLFEVERFDNSPDGWFYYLPETEEQEQRLFTRMLEMASA